MEYRWANEEKTGVNMIRDDGSVVHMESGHPEYASAEMYAQPYIGAVTKSPPVDPDKIRAKRDDLLVASDWTQVADAPVDKTDWAEYRQSLRDIPDQAGFPDVVVWPDSPN